MTDEVFADHYAPLGEFTVGRLTQIEELVRSIVPDVTAVIAYGIPTFRLKGKNFVHWAGFDKHVGFYPTPPVIEHFADEFGDRTWAKGSVQFPHTEPLPLDLIERMIRYRLELATSSPR
ncbi:MAG: DUF1801 domain-containing protein [Kineosporiaceae bacterium]|nr:DUF1801 domain-containing protein [Kineosporiaceae bacterium]MBK8074158.1 DUF1801 domain-containing protein [Kineosporiaceae bacterium]